MEPRNPTEDVLPDFLSDDWEAARDAIVLGGKSVEEAAEILKQGWQTLHDKNIQTWNEHLEQRRRNQNTEEERRRADQPDNDPDGDDPPDWLNKPTPSFLDIQPARHILKRLEKKEFVELWHFTAQGCHEAATTDLNSSEDTFGIIHTDKGVAFQSITASSTSTKVIRDEELTWDQLTEGKTRLIGCMVPCGWNKHEAKQLAGFFLELDIHPIRSQPYGLQTILRYQEKVRRDWTQALKTKNPYAIATISHQLLREYQTQIGLEILGRNNVSYLYLTPDGQH